VGLGREVVSEERLSQRHSFASQLRLRPSPPASAPVRPFARASTAAGLSAAEDSSITGMSVPVRPFPRASTAAGFRRSVPAQVRVARSGKQQRSKLQVTQLEETQLQGTQLQGTQLQGTQHVSPAGVLYAHKCDTAAGVQCAHRCEGVTQLQVTRWNRRAGSSDSHCSRTCLFFCLFLLALKWSRMFHPAYLWPSLGNLSD